MIIILEKIITILSFTTIIIWLGLFIFSLRTKNLQSAIASKKATGCLIVALLAKFVSLYLKYGKSPFEESMYVESADTIKIILIGTVLIVLATIVIISYLHNKSTKNICPESSEVKITSIEPYTDKPASDDAEKQSYDICNKK